MSLSLTVPPYPRSVLSSMKQQVVEELLRRVEELEQAEAWLLGEKEAAENTSCVAAQGGGHGTAQAIRTTPMLLM
jgi:hypothetical protein